jgi:hypothetical protein
MKLKITLCLSLFVFALSGFSQEGEAALAQEKPSCVLKAEAKGKACRMKCCREAAKEGKACEKCLKRDQVRKAKAEKKAKKSQASTPASEEAAR